MAYSFYSIIVIYIHLKLSGSFFTIPPIRIFLLKIPKENLKKKLVNNEICYTESVYKSYEFTTFALV